MSVLFLELFSTLDTLAQYSDSGSMHAMTALHVARQIWHLLTTLEPGVWEVDLSRLSGPSHEEGEEGRQADSQTVRERRWRR